MDLVNDYLIHWQNANHYNLDSLSKARVPTVQVMCKNKQRWAMYSNKGRTMVRVFLFLFLSLCIARFQFYLHTISTVGNLTLQRIWIVGWVTSLTSLRVISPYKYLLVASPASPICTMKPRYQYIFGNLYSQGRFAEKQNFNFCFVPPERSKSVVVGMKL